MPRDRQYYVYIMANEVGSVLYTGVTNDLIRRLAEHKKANQKSFTGRYNATRLVYYEVHEEIESAIAREKQIKSGPREKKEELISEFNQYWRDLTDDVLGTMDQ